MSETSVIAVSPQLSSSYKSRETHGGERFAQRKSPNLTAKYFYNEEKRILELLCGFLETWNMASSSRVLFK